MRGRVSRGLVRGELGPVHFIVLSPTGPAPLEAVRVCSPLEAVSRQVGVGESSRAGEASLY